MSSLSPQAQLVIWPHYVSSQIDRLLLLEPLQGPLIFYSF